ncbi:HAD family hydrolase [Cohnella zeiphila]|uniref:HAD family hydrolase n=1 Tax=Cohnella zeiphila TaxID=2761120 RepID=A0A7X0VX67_9BACL|nr:HAD hydrolase-like protein [Cohnella zeiphila]MBB6733255.1 HAD family hydrolase [Cohnella zeiphila]
MLKCLIFDLDGTIGNTLPLCIAAFRKSIEPLAGRSVSDQEIIDTFGPSEEGTIRALIPEHEERGVEDYLAHYRGLHAMCEAPFDGMKEILELARSRGARLAMVTGKGARSAVITLDVFGIREFFEIVETGSPDGPRKVQGIGNVLKSLEIAPEESLYIGDTPSDIVSSREAGVPIAAAAWAETAEPERLRELEPDEMFTDLEQFKAYLEKVLPQ